MTRSPSSTFRALLLVAVGLAPAATRRDLDVSVPPGSPQDLAVGYLSGSPRESGALSLSGRREDARAERSVSADAPRPRPLPGLSAHAQVRILTWDLGAHLDWIAPPRGPASFAGSVYGRPPVAFGEGAYWVTLAPLLRRLLHPEQVLRGETLAHLLQIGEPARAALEAARVEPDLEEDCKLLRELILRGTGLPVPRVEESELGPADRMWRGLVQRELLRAFPYDPEDDFGLRLELYPERVEPHLLALSFGKHLELRRAAVAALGSRTTAAAREALLARSVASEDPVELLRALDGLGRFGRGTPPGPLVERLARGGALYERVGLLRALGRIGSQDALPALLELGRERLEARDVEQLVPLLASLLRIPAGARAEAVETFAGEVRKAVRRHPKEFRGASHRLAADVPDEPTTRADTLEQLAFLVQLAMRPGDEALVRALQRRPEDQKLRPRPSTRADFPDPTTTVLDPLGGVPARVRLFTLDALVRSGERGEERVRRVALTQGLDHDLRRHALQALPLTARDEVALAILEDDQDPLLRTLAFEALLADRHASARERARGTLQAALKSDEPLGTVQRYALTLALRFLDREGALSAAELVPLVERLAPTSERPLDRTAWMRTRIDDLVSRALARADVKRELGRWLAECERRGLADAREHEAFLLALLLSLRPDSPAPYRQAVRRQILARTLGREPEPLSLSGPWEAPASALFEPPVPLERDLFLSLGGTAEEAAVVALTGFLEGAPDPHRELLALALGRTGLRSAAPVLLRLLLDEAPAVRLAASEALVHLGAPWVDVDWIDGPGQARNQAAEEVYGWFVRPPR